MTQSAKPAQRAEQDIFEDLAVLCASPGYAEVIAAFCLRDNLITIGAKGLDGQALAKMFAFEHLCRTEIATLVGLLARGPMDLSVQTDAVLSEYSRKTEELLQELHWSLGSVAFSGLTPEMVSDPDFNPFKSAAVLREPIFYGAESAYHFQYRDLAVNKYTADDPWLQEHRGFSISAARQVMRAVELVQRGAAAVFLKAMKAGETPSPLSAYSFQSTDVAREATIELSVVEAVLDAFTFDDRQRNPTFLTLSDFNATNATPLLRLPDGRYLLFQVYSLVEALYESPFFWLMGDKTYRASAASHRGAYIETFAAERLERVFGDARVFLNVIIPGAKGKTRGEIDVLVLFGDRAIIVQAKAKRLTLEARKGNDLQLQNDFKAAVQDACDQAMECAALLLQPGITLLDQNGETITVGTPTEHIYPLCLVGDHYPALTFQARQFLTFTPADKVATPLAFDVFALDVMSEMLTSPLRFLSYLGHRVEGGDKFLASSELTLLGYHLARNLWAASDVNMMALHDDVAADLDAAMMVRREGFPGKRVPEGILTRLEETTVARLIKAIDDDPHPSVLALGLFLLELDEDTVRAISDAMDRASAATRRDRTPHDASLLVQETGITVHANKLHDDEALELLRNHCTKRKYSLKADRWFGVSLEVESGRPRFGLLVDKPWVHNEEMEAAVANLPEPQAFRGRMPLFRTAKPGRNEPCPCGSGRKYKKCCLT